KHMSLKRLLYLCHLRYSDRSLQQKQAARLQRRQKGQPKQWQGLWMRRSAPKSSGMVIRSQRLVWD
ncbi:unnamed protein product, partial [Durusdinium trenchii]